MKKTYIFSLALYTLFCLYMSLLFWYAWERIECSIELARKDAYDKIYYIIGTLEGAQDLLYQWLFEITVCFLIYMIVRSYVPSPLDGLPEQLPWNSYNLGLDIHYDSHACLRKNIEYGIIVLKRAATAA